MENENTMKEKELIIQIETGFRYVVVLKSNGDAIIWDISDDKQPKEVARWNNIKQVSNRFIHVVGVTHDGKVKAFGDNVHKQCNVDEWNEIVEVVAGHYHTVGLKKDGKVVAVGRNNEKQCEVDKWKKIKSISAGHWHTVGVTDSGQVEVSGDNKERQCKIKISILRAIGKKIMELVDKYTKRSSNKKSHTRRIHKITKAIAGWGHTIMLKKDGRVIGIGNNEYKQCDVEKWTNMVDVAIGDHHVIGLKNDGTVLATGRSEYGECNVGEWKGVDKISATGYNTIGFTKKDDILIVGRYSKEIYSIIRT